LSNPATDRHLVITGSEGLVGNLLVHHFEPLYEVHRLDLKLGHDLTDETFIADWFAGHKGLSGMIVCHAYNPVPVKNAPTVEPIDVSSAEIRGYLEVNVLSAFNVCREFIRNNDAGSIINIGSLYGLRSPRHYIYSDYVKPIGYSLSKAGIVLMTKYLAAYYAPRFRFNTVVLGGVADEKQDPAFVANYRAHTPMGRMLSPKEIPAVFEMLLDNRGGYITGTEIFVDGGWTAW